MYSIVLNPALRLSYIEFAHPIYFEAAKEMFESEYDRYLAIYGEHQAPEKASPSGETSELQSDSMKEFLARKNMKMAGGELINYTNDVSPLTKTDTISALNWYKVGCTTCFVRQS